MNISIKATHHDLTSQTRALVEEKFKAIDRLVASAVAPASLSCEIEQSVAVECAGAKYRAEGNLSVDGKLFRAQATGMTLEEAVDRVRDELTRELKRSSGKERGYLKRGGAALKRMLRMGS